MKITRDAIWKTVLQAVQKMQKEADYIVLYEDSRKLFDKNFDFYYNQISDKFMSDELEEHRLDRHKVAAVIICSILKTKIVGISQESLEVCEKKEFLGNEKIAFEVALSYMYSSLKKRFEEGNIPYENLFDRYELPNPYSCDRKYGEVICRDLYFSNNFYELSPLLLANLMFFIEEYSFSSNGIKRKTTT